MIKTYVLVGLAVLSGTEADVNFAKSMLQAWMSGPQKFETLEQMAKTPGFKDGACAYISQAMALRPNNDFLFKMSDAIGCPKEFKDKQESMIKLPEHDGIRQAFRARQKEYSDPNFLENITDEQKEGLQYEAKTEEEEVTRYTQATLRHSAAAAMKLTALFYGSHKQVEHIMSIHDEYCDDDTAWEIVTSSGNMKGNDCATRWLNLSHLCKPKVSAEDFACQAPGVCHVPVQCGHESEEPFIATESLKWNLETGKLMSIKIAPPEKKLEPLHPNGKDL